ncbi:MAG: HepT-like ribonuclease domain-containing protein [Methanobacteriota archaeon]
MVEHAKEILEYASQGKDAFLEERMRRQAIVRCLEVIGEASKRLSPVLRDANPDVRWREIAGFRDVLIHGYDRIDAQTVWGIIEDDLPDILFRLERMLRDLP